MNLRIQPNMLKHLAFASTFLFVAAGCGDDDNQNATSPTQKAAEEVAKKTAPIQAPVDTSSRDNAASSYQTKLKALDDQVTRIHNEFAKDPTQVHQVVDAQIAQLRAERNSAEAQINVLKNANPTNFQGELQTTEQAFQQATATLTKLLQKVEFAKAVEATLPDIQNRIQNDLSTDVPRQQQDATFQTLTTKRQERNTQIQSLYQQVQHDVEALKMARLNEVQAAVEKLTQSSNALHQEVEFSANAQTYQNSVLQRLETVDSRIQSLHNRSQQAASNNEQAQLQARLNDITQLRQDLEQKLARFWNANQEEYATLQPEIEAGLTNLENITND